jgi:hypothetical protein
MDLTQSQKMPYEMKIAHKLIYPLFTPSQLYTGVVLLGVEVGNLTLIPY